MFKLFAALLVALAPIVLSSSADAQKPAHYREVVPIASVTTDPLWCRPKSGGYDTPPVFGDTNGEKCEETVADLNFEPATQRLIYWASGGDCHLSVIAKVFKSDVDKRIRIVLNTTYGGCRAAGWKAGWILIDKPEKGYLVSVENVDIDRIHNSNEETRDAEFRFPAPPSVVTSKEIEILRFEDAGCLRLTGKSQHLISSVESLQRTLADYPPEHPCQKLFRLVKPDFSKEVLLGASFQSGYCDLPFGLDYTLIKETSSNPRENTVVFKLTYTDVPKDKFCMVYKTYAIWVRAPKFDPGYQFVVDARPISIGHLPRNIEEKIEWREL